jgi:hypothetical protein
MKPKIVLCIVSIFILALLLRVYNYNNYPLGFDQVQILENAEKIKSGDFTLVGPRTGPADMFTGPLIYYVCALLLVIIPSPWVIVATSVFLAFLTGIFLYLLLRRYVKQEKLFIVYFSIWALSPYIIYLDRIPWNPNLSFLSSILVFFPLLKIAKEKSFELVDCVLISLGIFLGYQAHFSGLLLFPLSIISALMFLKFTQKSVLLILSSCLGFLSTLLPTIIFDLRNNFPNLKGLIFFFDDKVDPDKTVLLIRLLTNLLTTVLHFGEFLMRGNISITLTFLSLFFFLGYVYMQVKQGRIKDSVNKFLLIWLLSFPLLYVFYLGNIPEYYYLAQFPAVIYILANFISENFSRETTYVFILGTIFLAASNVQAYAYRDGLTIENQILASNRIKAIAANAGVKEIIYDMGIVDHLGLEYLLKNIKFNDRGESVHVIFPYKKDSFKSYVFNNLAIWIDPRKPELNNLFTDEYIISSTKEYQILRDEYRNTGFHTDINYKIFQKEGYEHVGDIMIFLKDDNNNEYKNLRNLYDKKIDPNKYKSFVYKDQPVYLDRVGENMVVYRPVSEEFDLTNCIKRITIYFSK